MPAKRLECLPVKTFDLGPFHLELVFLVQRERDIALQWLVEQIRQVGAAGPD